MERAASLNCTCTLRLRQKATLIFPVVAAHLQSHASIAQNALGISHALVQQGQYCASAASQRTRVDRVVCMRCQQVKLEHGDELQPWR